MLSAHQPSASKRSTLAASASAARSLRRGAIAQASNLNGTVTLQPRPPASAKARTAAAKPSRGASTRSYTIACPVWRANAAWMNGDWLCATGLPTTA